MSRGYAEEMTQREYEDQPEAPDLGEYIQQDSAETLTGPPNSEALDAGYVPPDRPFGLDDVQAGAQTGSEPEDLDTRLSRERPDVTVDDPTGGRDTDLERSGRLEAVSPGADGTYDRSTEAVDTGLAGGAASAEEAAVHDRE